MPTYNYYCSDCDSHLSYFQRMSESPISNCENCGGMVKRLITGGTGLIFKGTGFYLTDYKDSKKSSETEAGTDSDKKEKSEKSTEGKTKSSDSKAGKSEIKSAEKKGE